LQIVSRFVLKRLGLRVLKGQEDSWDDVPAHPWLVPWRDRLSPYLRDYADYIVVAKRRVLIVDVKAPPGIRIRPNLGPFSGTCITFSKREWEAYKTSPVPVAILVWDYNGVKALHEQDHPLFYMIKEFASLPTFEELTYQIQVRIEPRGVTPHKLSPQVFRRFLEKTRAMEIVGIEPGRIIYR
jgi:hypothetical protein